MRLPRFTSVILYSSPVTSGSGKTHYPPASQVDIAPSRTCAERTARCQSRSARHTPPLSTCAVCSNPRSLAPHLPGPAAASRTQSLRTCATCSTARPRWRASPIAPPRTCCPACSSYTRG
ncbi:uncharacterized protein B0I36DRAFT_325923 [Microdochium trichocladiopsis]|uniref:Uncharacterized protein n=1 Tax=Microdochium trichocladiopsis TaxID=1682393 RepID=A0A9P9BT63_9PEZI|nr:uncharacterized protein B0I36DRAFT_325923 [Microdochium trichocladiopsis]KAH7029516.1 hypothetical protein B0I36DRAFT_325923 [Microdochium trichocladiopsis]